MSVSFQFRAPLLPCLRAWLPRCRNARETFGGLKTMVGMIGCAEEGV